MAKSLIRFTNIDTTPDLGSLLSFSINGKPYSFVFVRNRTESYQIELTLDLLDRIFSANKMRAAFEADLNQFSDFTITSGTDKVQITSKNDGDKFSDFSSSSFVPTIINQLDSETPFAITSEYKTFGDDNFNTHYRYVFKTEHSTFSSGFARESGSSPTINGTVTDNGKTIFFDLPRDTPFTFTVLDSSFERIKSFSSAIHVLSSENFSYKQDRTPSGTNLKVFYDNPIVKDYSIDGVNFQTSFLFPNLTPGEYVITVRDIYLGILETTIFIEESFLGEEYFKISELNSVPFVRNEVVDDCTTFKNLDNTLSCNEDVDSVKQYIHDFKDCDVIKIQFKSSYSINTIKVTGEGLDSSISVEKKSNYINLSSRIDANYTSYGSNKTGIYFTSGNIYDSDTGLFSDTYLLNGALPVWGVIGNFIRINNIYHEITDIVYNEDLGVKMLIIDSVVTFTSPVYCIYNLFEYEVYEFIVLASSFLGQKFRFNITATDNRFGVKDYISEYIQVLEDIESSVYVLARNRTNTDINYETGISHSLRVRYIKKYEEPLQESQNQKTDNSAYLISSDNYKQTILELEPVTTNIMYQLNAIFSSSELYVNGVGYVKNGEFDIEGALEDSNLYLITLKLIRTGKVYDAQEFTENNGLDFSGFEIPQLSSGESNFVNSNNGMVNSGENFITY